MWLTQDKLKVVLILFCNLFSCSEKAFFFYLIYCIKTIFLFYFSNKPKKKSQNLNLKTKIPNIQTNNIKFYTEKKTCVGNKTQCDICNSKAARKARLKKEKEQQAQDPGAGAAAAAFAGEGEGGEAGAEGAASEPSTPTTSKQHEEGIWIV